MKSLTTWVAVGLVSLALVALGAAIIDHYTQGPDPPLPPDIMELVTPDYELKSIGNPVCILWEDAATYHHTWISVETILKIKPPSVASCGWVVKETDERIWMALDMTLDDGVAYYAGIASIPRGWIWQVLTD